MTKDLFDYYDLLNQESKDLLESIPLYALPKQKNRKEELSEYHPEFLEGEELDVY